jgi:hypothetical protein
MGKKIKNLLGEKFGRLTVTKYYNSEDQGKTIKWECICECGNTHITTRRLLVGGHVSSCGCLRLETTKKNQKKSLKPLFIASGNALFSVYQRAAKRRGYQFTLLKEEFLRITKQNCHYCGSVPISIMKRKDYNGSYVYNGIDRKNNKEGYTIENSVPCCIICNKAKGTKSYNEFMEWVERIVNFNKLNKI